MNSLVDLTESDLNRVIENAKERKYIRRRMEDEEYRKVHSKRTIIDANNHPHRTWVSMTIRNHKKRKFEVSVTHEELMQAAHEAQFCPICGVNLDWRFGTKGRPLPNSPTLDRVNNEKIITSDNFQIICYRCNSGKGQTSTEDYIIYCGVVYNRNKNRLGI